MEGRTKIQNDIAVHLVRKSLGGNYHELIAGRLAFSSSFSWHLRDDITVQVVFFNLPGLESLDSELTFLNRLRLKVDLSRRNT